MDDRLLWRDHDLFAVQLRLRTVQLGSGVPLRNERRLQRDHELLQDWSHAVQLVLWLQLRILPTLASSNTNLPTLMIGERFGE